MLALVALPALAVLEAAPDTTGAAFFVALEDGPGDAPGRLGLEGGRPARR